MRTQLAGIVVIGILGVLGMGVLAGYFSEQSPRVRLKVRAERELPVEILEVTDDAPRGSGPTVPRVLRVRGRARGGADASPDLARRVALLAHELFMKRTSGRITVTRYEVTLDGVEPLVVHANVLERRAFLEEVLAGARLGLAHELGADASFEVVDDAAGLGVVARGTPSDRDATAVARAVLTRTGFQFAFVQVGDERVEAEQLRPTRSRAVAPPRAPPRAPPQPAAAPAPPASAPSEAPPQAD